MRGGQLRTMFSFCIEDRGIYYADSKRVLVNPAKHESIHEIFDTITHEVIHQAIASEELDEIQEHWAIQKVMWIMEYTV